MLATYLSVLGIVGFINFFLLYYRFQKKNKIDGAIAILLFGLGGALGGWIYLLFDSALFRHKLYKNTLFFASVIQGALLFTILIKELWF